MTKMLDNPVYLLSLGVFALSHLPTTNAALSWSVCTKDQSGKKVCKDRIPRGQRIAIAIICLLVIVLMLTLVVCLIRKRRQTADTEREYNVEASQVEGPPTIIATEYNAHSGPSPVYSAKMTGPMVAQGAEGFQPPMSGPAYPASTQYYNGDMYYNGQHQTAPHSQATFPQTHPFVSYSPGMGPPAPKTAFVSGFPRPLLAGERLKDRIKERPASISSLTTIPAPAYRS